MKPMSDFFDDIRFILKDYDLTVVQYACKLFEPADPDFAHTKPFFKLSNDEYFIKRLAQFFFSSSLNDDHKKRIIEVLIGFGTFESLDTLFKIYTSITDEFKLFAREELQKHGYGFVDEYSKLYETYKNNACILELMKDIIDRSGYYSDLKDMLDYPSEKIILYVLKQLYKFCDEKILPTLLILKKDSNWMIRFNVLQVVKRIDSPKSRKELLEFLADDNIKVREETKSFVNSCYSLFADIILDNIDNPGSIGDFTYFQGILEIFECHPDITRLAQVMKIMVEYPEAISLKARSAFYSLIKNTFPPHELVLDRSGERYQQMQFALSRLVRWNSEQSSKLIGRIIENFGYLYIDILCDEYFKIKNDDAKNLITRIFKDRQFFLKDRQITLELCNNLDYEGINRFIKFVIASRAKEYIIPAFTKILETLTHKRTVELFKIFVENGLNTRGFDVKYKTEIKNSNAIVRSECIEALGFLKDPELLTIMAQDWKTYQPEVKVLALDTIEKNFPGPESIKLLSHVFNYDENYQLKERTLNLIAKIDCAESTEIILNAFGNPKQQIAELASKILVEKGRERLINQINVLPDNLKQQLGDILIKNDKNFIEEIEKQIASTDPKIRAQIIKLLTYLSKDERTKILNLLKKFVKNPDPHIRADFTKLMEIIGGKDIVDYVSSLINDDNPRVKANAIEVIAALNLKEISNMLFPLTSHINNRVRANAIIALYKLGNTNVIIGLSEMLRSHDKWMRASATYALGEISDPRVLPLLYTVLNDGDPDVIKNAFRVIQKIGDEESIKHIIKFLNHDNKQIKTAASEAINQLKRENTGKV